MRRRDRGTLLPSSLVRLAIMISPAVAGLPHPGRFAVLLVLGVIVCWLLAAGRPDPTIPAARKIF